MELRQYGQVIWKHLWIILLTTVIGAGVAFYFSYTAPTIYRATTTLEMDPTAGSLNDPNTAYSYVYYAQMVAEQAVKGFSMRLESPEFTQEMQDRLGLAQMGGSIDIQQVEESQFLRISAESEDPALAQALADTAAQVLIEQETSRQQARIREALDELEAEIEAREEEIAETRQQLALLGASDETSSEFVRQERSQLESRLSRNETRLLVMLDSAEEFRRALTQRADYLSVYTPARLPGAAMGQPIAQRTLLGAATGLVIGLSLAFLLEYLDDTIRTPEDVKRSLRVGVLGSLPRLQGTPSDSLHLAVAQDPFQPVSEAFRSLRTSVQFSGVDGPLRTLVVTSPLPTEGKTFTAANLAAVMAQGGRRVILVDGDLRRPTQHRLFGLPREPGLTSGMFSPPAEARDAVPSASAPQPVTGGEGRWGFLRDTDVDGLRVLTSGEQAPNPAELLASHRFELLVSWLKTQADLIIFDSPPVLAVTDASLLANQMDGTLLVVDAGKTRRPAALRAVERLNAVGGNVLGVVLNRLASGSDGYYHYYYYDADHYGGEDGRFGREAGWLARLLGRERRGRHRPRQRSRSADQRQGGARDA